MIDRVIFFIGTKFSKYDYDRFGFEIIQKRGFKVEAWDFSPWLRPDYYANYNLPNPIEFSGKRVLHNFEDIQLNLGDLLDPKLAQSA